jgi:hypothetical protein
MQLLQREPSEGMAACCLPQRGPPHTDPNHWQD